MDELIPILKALSDENRYELLKLLIKHDYCVGALASMLNISESAVSQHLKVLRNADIVSGDKRGYYTHYRVNRDKLQKLADKIGELSQTMPHQNECRKSMAESHSCGGKEKDDE